MAKLLYLFILLAVETSLVLVSGMSPLQLSTYCARPDGISVAGGSHDRLVTEGGRITLTCCMLGTTNGHDHEQLAWVAPNGVQLPNHFTSPSLINAQQQTAYSIPDFRSRFHLVTTLVIQRMGHEDGGRYTCQKANGDMSIQAASVLLLIRPRLLADYVPMPPNSVRESGAAVVAGRPAFVTLEDGRPGRLVCRKNRNERVNDIYLTWYFQGRQLIPPAFAVRRDAQSGRGASLRFRHSDWEGRNPLMQDDPREREDWEFRNGISENGELPTSGGRAMSLDPAELNITIENDGQTLSIARVNGHHAGIYLCKAEATNPIWTGSHGGGLQSGAYESGVIESPVLVQLQAIRGIVFAPPRILPGSPLEIPGKRRYHSPLPGIRLQRRKREVSVQSQKPVPVMTAGERFYMRGPAPKLSEIPYMQRQMHASYSKPVAEEGGKLVLECEARGKPTPQLIWYRGGMGSMITKESQSVTFDQRIKEALDHLPLTDVQRQLGTKIADNHGLLDPILGLDQKSDRTDQPGQPSNTAEYDEGEPKMLTEEQGGIITQNIGRFALKFGVRKDEKGDPVIAVSQLTIADLRPADATRYTCLALLDLSHFGGEGNYTDVGSVLPDVIFRPRFVKSGTHLTAHRRVGENATLTCEAFGGLPKPNGLRIRLLRGPGVPRLMKLASAGQLLPTFWNRVTPTVSPQTSGFYSLSGVKGSQSLTYGRQFDAAPDKYPRTQARPGNSEEELLSLPDDVEVISAETSERYQLSLNTDEHNPYASILKLYISDLQPGDNAQIACEASAGSQGRVFAPSLGEGLGRLTVWFPPTDVQPRGESSSAGESGPVRTSPGDGEHHEVVYGLAHQPSRLACQALGQPTPKWSWSGPQTQREVRMGTASGLKGYYSQPQVRGTGSSIPLGNISMIERGILMTGHLRISIIHPQVYGQERYTQTDYQEGELSISELTVPAGYRDVGVFGTYSCTASNDLGTGTGTMRLKLATHPGRPSLKACKVESRMIELCVEPPTETGGLPLAHYELRIQTSLHGPFHGPFAYLPGRRLLRLPHLIPGYFYRFALSAVSQAGRGPNAYLQVTTKRITTPVIKILPAQEYIGPRTYNLHWELSNNAGTEVDEYTINFRPVEVDYSQGEMNTHPVGGWTEYTITRPKCATRPSDGEADNTYCHYRVEGLRPDTTYELKLHGKNSQGFSELQHILFKTSSLSGASGQMLQVPAFLQQVENRSRRIDFKRQIYAIFTLSYLLLRWS